MNWLVFLMTTGIFLAIYSFNIILIKIPTAFFIEVGKKPSQNLYEITNLPNSQRNPEKEE